MPIDCHTGQCSSKESNEAFTEDALTQMEFTLHLLQDSLSQTPLQVGVAM